MRTLFLTLLLLFSVCTCVSAQNITITADIALAADQCDPVINDPNTDCISVPAGNDLLTYLPGQDGDIIVTYRLTNNSAGTITQASVTDSDRGTIIPVSVVNIPPGTTVTTNRIYPAETTSRNVTATVTANVESAAGASLSVEGEYTLDVVAPTVSVEFGVARQADICDNEPLAPNCNIPFGALDGQTITVGAKDTFTTRYAWTNTGLGDYDLINIVDQDGFQIANTGFDQTPGQTLISARHWEAPANPGTYNYSQILTITDQGGNVVTQTVTYIVIVQAPMVSVEFGVARQADVCDNTIAPNCIIPFGALNGQTVTVGAKDTFTTRYAWTNTGLGDYDLINIVDQDGFQIANTGFDQTPGQTLISARHWEAPADPGTYNYSQILTITDQGGNVVTETVTYIVIVDCSVADLAEPTALCQDRSYTIMEGETQTINAGMIDNGSFDGCGSLAGGGIDITSFTCADEGTNTVTLTVGDLAGNSATCTSTVTINVTEAIYEGPNDDCVTTSVAVAGGQAWHDITTPGGKLIGQVIIGSNTNIAKVQASVYKSANMTETASGEGLLSKRIDLKMLDAGDNVVQPNTEQIYVRLYYTAAEIAALSAASPGTDTGTFSVTKTSNGDCGSGYTGENATAMNTTFHSFGCAGEDGYYEFFTGSFSTFYLFATEAILPVEMTVFTAHEVEKQRVQLNWATATETNNNYFAVEHSTDGRAFVEVGEVAGAGNGFETQGYAFLHLDPTVGQNFYRLRQVDFDGTETLSELRIVNVSSAGSLSVFPNPTTDELGIKGFSGGPVEVINMQGSRVLQGQLNENARLDVRRLPAGAYVLRAGGVSLRWVKR